MWLLLQCLCPLPLVVTLHLTDSGGSCSLLVGGSRGSAASHRHLHHYHSLLLLASLRNQVAAVLLLVVMLVLLRGGRLPVDVASPGLRQSLVELYLVSCHLLQVIALFQLSVWLRVLAEAYSTVLILLL